MQFHKHINHGLSNCTAFNTRVKVRMRARYLHWKNQSWFKVKSKSNMFTHFQRTSNNTSQTVGNARLTIIYPRRITEEKNHWTYTEPCMEDLTWQGWRQFRQSKPDNTSADFKGQQYKKRTLCRWTASLKPVLPFSSSPSIKNTRSTSSARRERRSATAQATAMIGPLLSVAPRP